MSMTIGEISFDHVKYDIFVDVLYLHVGDPSRAVAFDESLEGHALRFDAEGSLIGVSIFGARQIVETGRHLVVTMPVRNEVGKAFAQPEYLSARGVPLAVVLYGSE